MSPRQRQIIDGAITHYRSRAHQKTDIIFTLAGGRWRINKLFFEKGGKQYTECHVQQVRWAKKWLPGIGHYEVVGFRHLKRLNVDNVFKAIGEIICSQVHDA